MPALQTVRSLAIVKLTDYNKFISHGAWVYEYNIYVLTGSGSPGCVLQPLWVKSVKPLWRVIGILKNLLQLQCVNWPMTNIWEQREDHVYLSCSTFLHTSLQWNNSYLVNWCLRALIKCLTEKESKEQEMLIILHIKNCGISLQFLHYKSNHFQFFAVQCNLHCDRCCMYRVFHT